MYRLWMCSISCTPDTMQAVQSTCNCHDACPVVPEGCLKDRPHVPPNESGVQGPIGPLPELPSRCTPPVLCDGVPIKHHLIPLCSQEMTSHLVMARVDSHKANQDGLYVVAQPGCLLKNSPSWASVCHSSLEVTVSIYGSSLSRLT